MGDLDGLGMPIARLKLRIDVFSVATSGRLMSNTKRATVYFDEPLHKALRIKAAETTQAFRTSSIPRSGGHCRRTPTI